jgi:hypothetical protein
MNSNPKSKAFIITFISVLILLVAGYFLFYRGSGSTEGTIANRMFAPLLGTSKPKNVTPIKTTDNTNTQTETPLDTTQQNTNPAPTNNGPTNLTPPFQVVNANTNTNTGNTNTNTNTTPTIVADQCPEGNPVTFSPAEQAELDALLNDYYKIAAKLKTEADIQAVNDAGTEYTSLIKTSNELTLDCKQEKADPAYTGPQVVKSNPYYQNPSDPTTVAYLVDETTDPIGSLIATAIKYHPNGAFGPMGGDIEPAYGACVYSIGHPCTGSALNPVYANLDTFFTSWDDFEDLFGIW